MPAWDSDIFARNQRCKAQFFSQSRQNKLALPCHAPPFRQMIGPHIIPQRHSAYRCALHQRLGHDLRLNHIRPPAVHSGLSAVVTLPGITYKLTKVVPRSSSAARFEFAVSIATIASRAAGPLHSSPRFVNCTLGAGCRNGFLYICTEQWPMASCE